MIKNVFVLNVNDYRPDLCQYTLPTIQAYAERIGASYREIKERKFPDWPVTYEKLQVHELGKDADWNILIDADTMVHPDAPDFTEVLQPGIIGFLSGHDMRNMFSANKYFLRCGHTQAIASGFLVSSRLTHDLWRPLKMSREEALFQTRREFIVDEYALTYNLARFGLRFTGLLPPDQQFLVHLGSEEQSPEQRIEDAKRAGNLASEWGFR